MIRPSAPNHLATPARILAWIAHALVLGMAGGLLFFAHPQADDLYRAARTRDLGLAKAVYEEYVGWSGRWLGTGLSYAVSSIADVRRHYTLSLCVIALIVWAAIWFLIRRAMGKAMSSGMALALSVSFVALYWTGMPGPGQTFYWFTGGLENLLGVALPMVLLAILIGLPTRDGPTANRWMAIVLAVLLALILPGLHELYGLLLCIVLALSTAIAWRSLHANRWIWTAATVAAGVGLFIVIHAPGNSERQETQHFEAHAGAVLKFVAQTTVHLAVRWIVDARLLAASLLFALHPRIRPLRPAWLKLENAHWKWLFPLATLGLLVIGCAAPLWKTGRLEERTASALYMIFLIGWFLTLFVWTRTPTGLAPPSPALMRRASIALALFSVCLVTLPDRRLSSGKPAVASWGRDLFTRTPAYDRAMQSRYRNIQAALDAGEKSVTIHALPAGVEPWLFMHADVAESGYRYDDTVEFYGLKSLHISPPQ